MKKTETIKPIIAFKRPESLKGAVEFDLPDGTTAKLACEFEYRTRTEFGKLWDEISASASDVAKPAAKEGEEPQAVTFAGMMDRSNEVNAENTLRYVKAWPADMPALSKETLKQLFDEVPTAQGAFFGAYRALCLQGYVGN